MRYPVLFVLIGFFLISFIRNNSPADKYELSLEAKGCHFQVMINDVMVFDDKSYQTVNKNLNIDKHLTGIGEQNVDIKMLRISREMPLKNTGGMLNLKLNKITSDSVILIKEVNLPTFPYDDDEVQPFSIGGTIKFEMIPEQPEISEEELDEFNKEKSTKETE